MSDKPPVVDATELLFRERELGVPPVELRQRDVRWARWALIGGVVVFWAAVGVAVWMI